MKNNKNNNEKPKHDRYAEISPPKPKHDRYAEISPPKIKFTPEKIAKILEKQNKKDN